MSQVQISYSLDGKLYALEGIRECALWMSVEKHPLPVPDGWHRPGIVMAAVMRGRDYYRICQFAPASLGQRVTIDDDNELVTDYRDAAWWTLGLEQAWAEIDKLKRERLSVVPSAPAIASAANKDKREVRPQS